MVTINALTSTQGLFLVIENTNLSDFPRYASDIFIGSRAGETLGGVALGDVVDFAVSQRRGTAHVVWNGSSLTQDDAGAVTGGRFTSVIGTTTPTGGATTIEFTMTGLQMDAGAFWRAAMTRGTRGDDVALMSRAFQGNDLFRLSDRRDVVSAGLGNDRLFGNAGNDDLRGGAGQDRIDGGAGNDRLFGDAGDDRLQGGGGRDRLYGDTGTDTMAGGAGADVFVFHGLSGRDTITDFNGLQDKILIESGAASIDDIAMSAEPGRLTLSFGQTVITLTGPGLNSFDDSDILFL